MQTYSYYFGVWNLSGTFYLRSLKQSEVNVFIETCDQGFFFQERCSISVQEVINGSESGHFGIEITIFVYYDLGKKGYEFVFLLEDLLAQLFCTPAYSAEQIDCRVSISYWSSRFRCFNGSV